MKPADKLTLAELEAIAKRMETAARTIREAMAVVGGQPPLQVHAPTAGPRFIPNQGPPQPDPTINSEDTDPRAKPISSLPPPSEKQLDRMEEQRLFLESRKGNKSAFLTQFAHDGAEESA